MATRPCELFWRGVPDLAVLPHSGVRPFQRQWKVALRAPLDVRACPWASADTRASCGAFLRPGRRWLCQPAPPVLENTIGQPIRQKGPWNRPYEGRALYSDANASAGNSSVKRGNDPRRVGSEIRRWPPEHRGYLNWAVMARREVGSVSVGQG